MPGDFLVIFRRFWHFGIIHRGILVILRLSEGSVCCFASAVPVGILAFGLFPGQNIWLIARFKWFLGIFRNSQAVFVHYQVILCGF